MENERKMNNPRNAWVKQILWSVFKKKVTAGKVSEITIEDERVTGTYVERA
jgi:hypothetical protein